MRLKGLEPPRLSTSGPKPDLATSYSTTAKNRFNRDVPTAHGSARIAASKSISLTILELYYSPSVSVCTLGSVPDTDNLLSDPAGIRTQDSHINLPLYVTIAKQ